MIGLEAPSPAASRAQVPQSERAVAALVVLLLHVVLLWLFVTSKPWVFPIDSVKFHTEPITLWLAIPKIGPAERSPIPSKAKDKHNTESLAPVVPQAKGVPLPPPKPTAPDTGSDYNGLRALGRYLTLCSGMDYEDLGDHDRSHCLADQWDIPLNAGDPNLRLGPQAPSVWKSQQERQSAPPPPFAKDCDATSRNSNLGLPCVDVAH